MNLKKHKKSLIIKNTVNALIIFSFLLAFAFNAVGQSATTGLPLTPSDLFAKLSELKAANPKITADELLKQATDLMNKNGLNYEFELDTNTCTKIAEARKQLKPEQGTAVGGRIKLTPKEGDAVLVFVPNFENSTCGKCYAPIPLVAATGQDFVAVIQGQNVGFVRPTNLGLNFIELVDNQNLNTTVRRWLTPQRSVPLGVSEDGNRLYLALPASGFEELALIVHENGVIELAKREGLDLKDKGTEVKDPANSLSVKYLSFGTGASKRVLKFSAPCN